MQRNVILANTAFGDKSLGIAAILAFDEQFNLSYFYRTIDIGSIFNELDYIGIMEVQRNFLFPLFECLCVLVSVNDFGALKWTA